MHLSAREKMRELLRHAPIRKVSLIFLGDLDGLRRDIDGILKINPNIGIHSIMVRRLEHAAPASGMLLELSHKSTENYLRAVELIHREYDGVEYTIPHLDERLRHPRIEYFNDAEERMDALLPVLDAFSAPVICAPESSYKFVQHRFRNREAVSVLRVPNRTYGGSISVAGLLTGKDLVSAWKASCARGDIAVVPREMFDKGRRDMRRQSVADIAVEMGVSLVLM